MENKIGNNYLIANFSCRQLSCWVATLDILEKKITHIMFNYGKANERFLSSPRRSQAMLVSGSVILAGSLAGSYARWLVFVGMIVGLIVYFLVMRYSSLPSNKKEHLIYTLDAITLPTDSLLYGMCFDCESSPVVIASQIKEAIRKEKGIINGMLSCNLSQQDEVH